MTPAEIIDQRAAGVITTEEMMEQLLNWSYTFGRVVCIGGVATDAYVAGDWDAIEMAYYLKQLSDDEFQRLADYAQAQKSAEGDGYIDVQAEPTDSARRKQITDYLELLTVSRDDDDGVCGRH